MKQQLGQLGARAIVGAILLGTVSVPFWGCGGGGESGGTTSTTNSTGGNGGNNSTRSPGYYGTILNVATGRGISGVTVIYGGQSVVTDANGAFAFNIPGGSAGGPASINANAYYRTVYFQGGGCAPDATNLTFPAIGVGEIKNVGTFLFTSKEDPPSSPCFP